MVGNFLSETYGIRSVSEDLADRLRFLGWHVYTTSNRPHRLARLNDMVIKIIRFHRKFKLAHVEVYSGYAFVWAEVCVFLLHYLRKPILLTLHGGNLPFFVRQSPDRVCQLLQRANFVTTPSHYIQEALLPLSSRILYIPNAIDIDHYSFRLRRKPRARIVWLRSFHAIYSPFTAVKVLALISSDFPEATLTMFGPDKKDGSLAEVLRLADELHIRNRLHIVGPIPKAEVPASLSQGDIFLNTTRYESFGISVVEAAAVGTPIVTSNVGELSHMWTDGRDALLAPPDNAPAMANAICRLINEEGLAESLSMNARKKAEQYDWRYVMPEWESLLRKALRNA